ncbi:4-alpha-L-fucosyltransferase [Erwinia sp. OLTSP20]|uniref:TDP-N-acetylfucosamine:lipid II N-acetylfucosaminyltransferase n=1 Tax=unclassified Erwinia TaxID=2622719 RepID=UPI000C18ACB2|nr:MULTISPECIES: TDP-N-acetylfucosamine:lipid II N-acetylfucosaminyltransferase [unclassified Erwinia]PIJ50773.1 4-alpha-L-fucosyltransferase [Erwinia sp. OAMSP11]PIJ72925.1 4-alpha-L-fucosyltransferase [Erwinia sp. OLSSP12]PIJ81940.1 4-alpha-L-fucosyltransferase [Erwinia sp. OLCASP19]PIJ84595.1 4-alpha-L-fucosyltransferase [Erwinia sp. OLMTSP26]PIJ86942.1 4-alpha-L-fucosyltransferase [Erwinia sp. OLMDSP33]
MTMLIHILGADIPHHNQTVLRFFNDKLASTAPFRRQFWVVNCSQELCRQLPALDIHSFMTQGQLAQAVIAHARRQRQDRFLFYGQFNLRIWLALLSGALQSHQMLWHIWGADLYEDRRGIVFRLFYGIRRLAQRRVGQVFATLGDLSVFHGRCPQVPGRQLYFPTRIPALPAASTPQQTATLRLLLGNSGDISNRHIAGLQAIHRSFGDRVQVVLPMGYPPGNETYIAQVEAAGCRLFPTRPPIILREKLDFTSYMALISQSNLGYFIFQRQQGIGTLCLLIQANVPLVISRHNPFWQDLAAANIPLLFAEDDLSQQQIAGAHQQLLAMDKTRIPFFAPGYTAGWKGLLQQLEDPGA